MSLTSPFPSLAMGMMGMQELLVIVIVMVLNALWIWAIVHCAVNRSLTDKERLVGLLVVVLLNFIGALLYAVWLRRGSLPTGTGN